MEESQEILLNSLASSGVPIPPGVSSIQDLAPATLFSICAHSLRIIANTSSFPTTLPESMADRFKICTDLALAIKDLGFIGDMSFHKFLYPSEEDMYKLVRFFVGRLSESSGTGKSAENKDESAGAIVKEENFKSTLHGLTQDIYNERVHTHGEQIITGLKDLRLRTEVMESSMIKLNDDFVGESSECDSVPQKMEEVAAVDIQDTSKDELTGMGYGGGSVENFPDSLNNTSGNGESVAQEDCKHVSELECTLTTHQQNSSEVSYKIKKLRSQEKVLLEEVTAKSSKLCHLEEELELLNAAVEMAFDKQNPIDLNITRLNEQVDARRQNVLELESEWDAHVKSLEEKKRSIEEVLYATKPEAREKLQKLKEIEIETQSVLSETKKRGDEISKLSTELDKQPKLPSRRSYIERIKEITKNSRKQDIDIERILKETRELQLESNTIQERLHRTYAVVAETLSREKGKKDPLGQQAYGLLTGIHETFEQISEKILATDRTRREIADHEAKLAVMASRSLNIDKLQADLDAIRQENELLQSRFHNN